MKGINGIRDTAIVVAAFVAYGIVSGYWYYCQFTALIQGAGL